MDLPAADIFVTEGSAARVLRTIEAQSLSSSHQIRCLPCGLAKTSGLFSEPGDVVNVEVSGLHFGLFHDSMNKILLVFLAVRRRPW
jgi:hypothetical protein